MSNYTTTEAREHFAELMNLVAYGKERQILIRHGKPMAALIPIEDLRYLEALEDQRDLEDARAELKRSRNQKNDSWKKAKEELGL